MECLKKLYGILVCVGNKLQCPVLLLVRVVWGWQFFEAGKGKLQNMPKTIEAFTQMHIPFPTLSTYLAATTECFGGLFLMLGLCSRLVSIPLAFTMCVAYMTAHFDTVKTIFSKPSDFLEAGPFPFLVASLIILAFGPGKISLDNAIDQFYLRRKVD